MRSSRKKRPGRLAPHRPVLSFRVSQELYDRVRQAAEVALAHRSISEEAEHRLAQAFELADALKSAHEVKQGAAEEARKILAAANSITPKLLEAELRRQGWKKVTGANGEAWFPRDVDSIQWIQATVDPETQTVLQEM